MPRHSLISRPAGLLALALLTGCSVSAGAPPAPPPAPTVEVQPVVFRDLRHWEDFTGKLEAIDTVEVRPRVSGQIVSAPFTEGARVRKGQVLFEIDPRPYQAEADRLAAELERARAKAQLAAADADRAQRLLDQNAIAKEEAERMISESRSARADVAAAEASLRAGRLNLEFTRVVSPIDGRVSRAMITRGNLVSPSDLLTTVVSDAPIYATFNTDEQTYLKYAASERNGGAPVYMGLMTETGFPHQGRLKFIDNAMDSRSGTIKGRAVFDNANGAFTPGLFARVRLVSQDAQQVAIAPERALGSDLGSRFVLVLGPGDHVVYRPVTLGAAVGEMRIVTSGLKPGDRVVVSGIQKVKPGDKVKAVPAAEPLTTAQLKALEPTA